MVAQVILLLAGLLVPGAALCRALRLPCTVATCFAGSAVSIYVTILTLQLTSICISVTTLAMGLSAISVFAFIAGRRSSETTAESLAEAPTQQSTPELRSLIRGMGAWTPLYALFWVAVVWRAWQEPLAGPDIEFRWSFLAEQMLRLGSLDFYPPLRAADFTSYFWVESIPPGASALHAWAYACGGGFEPKWTIPTVVLQLWSIHELLWRLAGRIGGLFAAGFACLAAAACPFLTWSVLLGQETGLTALAMLGIAYAIQVWNETRAPRWAALAGIFATLGASAREYGLVFPALAFVALIVFRADRRAWISFAACASASLVWPLRTLALTGNPFYSLPVANLPVNERFVAWIEHDAAAFGAVLHTLAGWSDVMRLLLSYALPAVAGWTLLFAAAIRRQRSPALALVATVVVLALWAASVRYTNGGLFYSLRVASPAFALGALAFGVSWASFHAPRSRSILTHTLMLLVLAFTIPATLALPANPWRTPLRAWPAFESRSPSIGVSDDSVRLILEAMEASSAPTPNPDVKPLVLADSPGYQRRFLPTGVKVVPLWSPQADWLFDPNLSPTDVVRHWRESGVRYIIITKWQSNLTFFNARSRWGRAPLRVQQIGETNLTAIFTIAAVE